MKTAAVQGEYLNLWSYKQFFFFFFSSQTCRLVQTLETKKKKKYSRVNILLNPASTKALLKNRRYTSYNPITNTAPIQIPDFQCAQSDLVK
jgi:hypothetical protein